MSTEALLQPCPICGEEYKVRGGGLTHHLRWHERQGDISKDCNIGDDGSIMPVWDEELDYLDHAFNRLAHYGTCAIQLDHPLIRKRKRIAKRVLFISMGALYGDPRAVVVGLAGGGCEALRLNNLSLTQLMRVGLPSEVAAMVLHRLESLTVRQQS